MNNIVLVRYGEISLKGLNRNFFEEKLVQNITFCLKRNDVSFTKVRRMRGRIIISTKDKCKCLKQVFGIVSFSPALMVNIDELEKVVKDIIKTKKFKTFSINTKRLDKSVKQNSMEFNINLGDFVLKHKKVKVDLSNPDLEIGVEIFENKAHVFTERTKGFAGLPVGVEGKVVAFLEDNNSEVAAWLAMKRGCSIIPVAFKEFDVTNLTKFSNNELKLIKVKSSKGIDEIAIKQKAPAVITGHNLETLDKLSFKTTVFCPLIGYSDSEIGKIKKELSS